MKRLLLLLGVFVLAACEKIDEPKSLGGTRWVLSVDEEPVFILEFGRTNVTLVYLEDGVEYPSTGTYTYRRPNVIFDLGLLNDTGKVEGDILWASVLLGDMYTPMREFKRAK